MASDDAPGLRDVLDRLEIVLSEPVDFAEQDPANTRAKVRLLTAAAAYFNVLAVSDFGGRSGAIRGEGILEQVVGAAFQSFEGVDPHPGQFEKAAMLLRGITQGHPFADGNKRTGFLLAAYYLSQVGHKWPAQLPEQDVIALCMRVSAGDLRDVDEIATELYRIWRHG
jgi:death-on-curing protein